MLIASGPRMGQCSRYQRPSTSSGKRGRVPVRHPVEIPPQGPFNVPDEEVASRGPQDAYLSHLFQRPFASSGKSGVPLQRQSSTPRRSNHASGDHRLRMPPDALHLRGKKGQFDEGRHPIAGAGPGTLSTVQHPHHTTGGQRNFPALPRKPPPVGEPDQFCAIFDQHGRGVEHDPSLQAPPEPAFPRETGTREPGKPRWSACALCP